MQGILNINKSKGITSFDVIAKLRKILQIKRIGHAGTLDPIATGVLPVFIGSATRLIQYVPKTKSYRAFARLGIETNTYDTEGEIISKKTQKYDYDEICGILKTFEGKILQTPPLYSAIKINGKKLYEYARKSQEVEIPQREVFIKKITVEQFDNNEDFPLLTFSVDCASGVYIRSIIHDLGEKLGSGAMMENLIRTMSASLELKDSIEIEKVTKENSADYLIDPNVIIDLPCYDINEKEFNKIRQGQYIFIEDKTEKELKLVYNGRLAAIGKSKEGVLKPKTVIL